MIVDHIEYLLREHDCVILPGWGAFIAQHQCARVVDDTLLPPSRSYGFNGALTFSDGLLESSIVRRNRCSYATASEKVRDAVAALKHQVEVAGEVAIGRIGTFTRNADGALVFSPFEHQIIASQFYGFATFSFPSLQPQSTVQEEEEDIAVVETSAWYRIGKKYMQIAASIIVLLVMTFVLSTPLAVNRQESDFAGINDSFKIHSSDNAVALADTGANRELAVALPEQAAQDSTKTGDTTISEDMPTAHEVTIGKYCLVVASGRSYEEARKFGEYHKSTGQTFRILESNGKFRVYVATDDSYEELTKVQNKLRNSFPESWICRR